jgi:hypothetical protein
MKNRPRHFDRSASHLPKGPDISKSLCDPNQKLSSIDRNERRPALFVRLEFILDESFVNLNLYIYEMRV